MNKARLRLLLITLVLIFTTLACGLFDGSGNYDRNPANIAPESNGEPVDESEEFYADEDEVEYDDLPEDCLENEVYDPAEELCIPVEDCEDCEPLEVDLQGFLNDIWDEAQVDGASGSEGEEQPLVIYQISGSKITNPQLQNIPTDLKALQQDRVTQEEIWQYFASLIPQKNRQMLTTFIVFTDGVDNSMAAVEQDEADPARWVLLIDIVDAANPKELTYTLIHEYGHLLTLNASQVQPNAELLADPENDDLYYEAVEACPFYFPGEGCSQPDAYIDAFYNRFWRDIYNEWLELDYIEDDDAYYDAIDAFYLKYQDQFVSDYAATNPEEDLAETWTYFVLKPKPAGNTIAEQKILFLYEYPELVALRNEIVTSISAESPGN